MTTLQEYISARRTDGDTVWMDGRDTWIRMGDGGDTIWLDGEFEPLDLRMIAEYLEQYRESKRSSDVIVY
jgi:hypothetical protein